MREDWPAEALTKSQWGALATRNGKSNLNVTNIAMSQDKHIIQILIYRYTEKGEILTLLIGTCALYSSNLNVA